MRIQNIYISHPDKIANASICFSFKNSEIVCTRSAPPCSGGQTSLKKGAANGTKNAQRLRHRKAPIICRGRKATKKMRVNEFWWPPCDFFGNAFGATTSAAPFLGTSLRHLPDGRSERLAIVNAPPPQPYLARALKFCSSRAKASGMPR